MSSIIVLLVVAGPAMQPTKQCITSCKQNYMDNIERCWFIEQAQCGKLGVCTPSKLRQCLPVVKNLGEWSAVPLAYTPLAYDTNLYPENTFVSHLNDPVETTNVSTYPYGPFKKTLAPP